MHEAELRQKLVELLGLLRPADEVEHEAAEEAEIKALLSDLRLAALCARFDCEASRRQLRSIRRELLRRFLQKGGQNE